MGMRRQDKFFFFFKGFNQDIFFSVDLEGLFWGASIGFAMLFFGSSYRSVLHFLLGFFVGCLVFFE